MNKPIMSRCGYRCDLCLAYEPNVIDHPENQRILSAGWHEYFGLSIPPEKILCDGCMTDNPSLIDQDCPVRPCALSKEILNCGDCEDYGCDKLRQRWVIFGEIASQVTKEIPEEDRKRFIFPYENKDRIDEIRRLKSKF
ncbi:MAG: DUF3795 domain-containing protein [Anaerolineaceae bacterium]|nr:DUF3795 domain-containing protein [Anaerolineaceae bacterium]